MRTYLRPLLALTATGLFLLTSPAQAQENRVGTQAGKQLGTQALLNRLVSTPYFPLRLALLPLVSFSSAQDLSDQTQTVFGQLQEDSDFHWLQLRADKASPLLPNNEMVMSLADQHKFDVLISPRIESLADGFWLLLGYFAGTDGKVLYSSKRHLTELQSDQIAAAIEADLARMPSPAINDLSHNPADPGELHLRTSPDQMLVYLNDVPVGKSPLFLRHLPLGSQTLHLVETQPYQIQRFQIVSEPPGVLVRINQRPLGVTPLELPVELRGEGEYQIAFESSENFVAEIRLQTEPDHIAVQLDDLPIQRTPVSFQQLRSKSYRLNFLSNPAVEVRQKIEIQSDQAQVLNLDAYKYAKLILNTSVKNARVELDHEYLGETPFSTHLTQGLHTLEVSKNRYLSAKQTLNLEAGSTREIQLELEPRSADSSIFLVPTGELTPKLNLSTKYLTFGNIEKEGKSYLSHLYGLEVGYGWPNLYHLANTFDLSVELSAFAFALQNEQEFRTFQGLGSKLQFLRESDNIPISAALGTYLNLDPQRPLAVGYLSLSRNFGDFALHLGLQTHGFNLSLGYTGWDNLRLGFLVYADSFFRLLAQEGESSTTFYGLQLGYSF